MVVAIFNSYTNTHSTHTARNTRINRFRRWKLVLYKMCAYGWKQCELILQITFHLFSIHLNCSVVHTVCTFYAARIMYEHNLATYIRLLRCTVRNTAQSTAFHSWMYLFACVQNMRTRVFVCVFVYLNPHSFFFCLFISVFHINEPNSDCVKWIEHGAGVRRHRGWESARISPTNACRQIDGSHQHHHTYRMRDRGILYPWCARGAEWLILFQFQSALSY